VATYYHLFKTKTNHPDKHTKLCSKVGSNFLLFFHHHPVLQPNRWVPRINCPGHHLFFFCSILFPPLKCYCHLPWSNPTHLLWEPRNAPPWDSPELTAWPTQWALLSSVPKLFGYFQHASSPSASLTMLKPLTVWITTSCGKFLKRWKYQTTLPASWETCMLVKKQQNWTWNKGLVQNWERSKSKLYIVTLLF